MQYSLSTPNDPFLQSRRGICLETINQRHAVIAYRYFNLFTKTHVVEYILDKNV